MGGVGWGLGGGGRRIWLTHSEGAEHLGKSIRELLIAFIHLQVHLTKVWSSVHAHLHKRRWPPAALLAGGGLLRAALLSHYVLPVIPHRRPPHHLCPAKFFKHEPYINNIIKYIISSHYRIKLLTETKHSHVTLLSDKENL